MSGPFGAGALQLFSAGDFFKHKIEHSVRLNRGDSAYLSWTPSSSGNRRIFTWSIWLKRMKGWDYRAGTTHEDAKYQKQDYVLSCNTTRITDGFSFDDPERTNGVDSTSHRYGFYNDNTVIEINHSNITNPGEVTKYLRSYNSIADPFAWAHVVLRFDTTQSNDYERLRYYINGIEWTSSHDPVVDNYGGWSYDVFPGLNEELDFNTANKEMNLGCYYNSGTQTHFFDGLLANIQFLDGTSAGPDTFGEDKNGIWIPKKFSGSYGSNGFHLDFANSASLGNDVSGNNNHWTPSAGITSVDQILDTPTRNYSTLAGNKDWWADNITFSEGNLRAVTDGTHTVDSGSARNGKQAVSNFTMTSGKYYAECRINDFQDDNNNSSHIGVVANYSTLPMAGNYGFEFDYEDNGAINAANTNIGTTFSQWSNGDVIGIALNIDDDSLTFYKNGSQITQISNLSTYAAAYSYGPDQNFPQDFAYQFYQGNSANDATDTDVTWNFGQDSSFGGLETPQGNGGAGEDFKYTPPTGHKGLSTDSMPEPVITPKLGNGPSNHFAVKLYEGTGAAKNITGLDFSPDMIWIKRISTSSTAENEVTLTNSVRGAGKHLLTSRPQNIADAVNDIEITNNQVITSINNDGFSIGTDADVNTNNIKYTAYCFRAGGSSTTSNSLGSITSQVSVNAEAGFSIVTYTGNGVLGATVGHGLGRKPKLIMVKSLNTSAKWRVYHFGMAGFFNQQYPIDGGHLASTMAYETTDPRNSVSYWNDTSPTNTVFTIGNSADTNPSDDMIAYCFAEVPGYSKIEYLYSGGFSDSDATGMGRFFALPFTPAMLFTYNISSSTSSYGKWYIFSDEESGASAPGPYGNATRKRMGSDTHTATDGSFDVNFMTGGFNMDGDRGLTGAADQEVIYMAFAKSPLKYSVNARTLNRQLV